MPLTEVHRSKLERLPSLMEPLMVLANVANPTIATVTYAYGLVMRVLQIGGQVRERVARGQGDLDAEVRAAGLFRVPLEVDVQPIQLQAFIGPGRSRFPRALEQLDDDVRVLDDPRHPDRRGARERLAIARSVIPQVYDHYERTGQLRHDDFPLLSTAYLHLLNPGEPRIYRALVRNLHIERTTLVDEDRSSLNLLRARLPAYVQAQLRVERDALDARQRQALAETIDSVRDIYWSFVLGDDDEPGVVKEAVDFLVERAVERIEDEREELAAERERLASLPADQRDDDRLAQIAAREEALRTLEDRLPERPR
jgi:hypothetical protein